MYLYVYDSILYHITSYISYMVVRTKEKTRQSFCEKKKQEFHLKLTNNRKRIAHCSLVHSIVISRNFTKIIIVITLDTLQAEY